MKLPTRIKVGRTWYDVSRVETLGHYMRGQWRHKERGNTDIRIAKRCSQCGPFSEAEQEESFWHELTHAILHDMDEKKLNADEQFVIKFSRRLSEAIRSAKFKQGEFDVETWKRENL